MKKILLFVFLLLFSSFSYANQTALSIKIDKEVKKISDNKVDVQVQISHTQDLVTSPMYYMFMAVDEDGKTIYKTEANQINFNLLTKKASFSDSISIDLSKDAKLFLVLKNQQGGFLTSSYLADIKGSGKKLIDIKNCNISAQENEINISCDTNSQDPYLIFEALDNNNELVLQHEGKVSVQDGKFSYSFASNLKPGKYTGYIYVKKDGSKSGYIIKTFTIPGDWISISQFSISNIKTGKYNVYLVVDGTPISGEQANPNKRGFIWWVIDEKNNICKYDNIDLTKLPPYEFTFKGDVPADCSNPSFVAVLYDNEKGGIYNIVEKIGNADFYSLLNAINEGNVKNNKISGIVYIALALVIIAVLAVLLTLFDKGKKVAFVIALFIFTYAYTNAATTYSQTKRTYDNPNATVSVEFSRDKFAPGKNVIFTFTLHDNMREKRVKGDIYAKINSGKYVKIINSSNVNNSDLFITQINNNAFKAPNTNGEHTLTIKIPGLCGSAFDFSKFNKQTFGVKDCEFSFDFSVDDKKIDCLPNDEECDTDDDDDDDSSISDPALDLVCSADNKKVTSLKFISFYDKDEDGVQDNIAYNINILDLGKYRVPVNGFTKAGEWKSVSVNTTSSNIRGTIYAVSEDGGQSDIKPFNLSCTGVSSCGNGLLEIDKGEQCDDGNTTSGDGCSERCEIEYGSYRCGNNIKEPQIGEQCDGTDTPAGKICTPYCRFKDDCELGMDIISSQKLVRPGGEVMISWQTPALASSCAIYANGKKAFDNALRVNSFVHRNFKGETEYELRCNSCGTVVSTSTKVYMGAGFIER